MFLFFEGISLLMVIQLNESQNQIFFSSANAAIGGVYEWFADWAGYFDLRKQNAKLLQDNQQLLAEKEQLRQLLGWKEDSARDTAITHMLTLSDDSTAVDSIKALYSFIGARVVNNSVTANNNMITLDKGLKDGVVRHAGVINGKGLVGIVRNVSEQYASVMSILHRQTRISASIKGQPYFGTLVWKNLDPTRMDLDAVPKHAVVKEGDTIVTSGYSHKFPPGIVIGVVDTTWIQAGDNFHTIHVRLVNDLSRLDHAYICVHKDRDELSKLERNQGNE